MLQNNQDKGEKFVEENYDRSIKELTWHLIKNKLVEQTGVKVEEQDIREIARQSTRAQFAQYGMGNIPDELIEKYADETSLFQKKTSFFKRLSIFFLNFVCG